MRSRYGPPKLPRRKQRGSHKAIQGAVEILAGIVLGFVGIAAADSITTSPDLRLLVAITAIVAVVLAEWGARYVAYRARGGNPANNNPDGRSRRG